MGFDADMTSTDISNVNAHEPSIDNEFGGFDAFVDFDANLASTDIGDIHTHEPPIEDSIKAYRMKLVLMEANVCAKKYHYIITY